MESEAIVKALAALAQSSRLAVFKSLVVAGGGGLTPGALADQLALAPSALSFHLKALAHAELISQERDGRHLVYRAQLERMNALMPYLTHNCCQGQACDLSVPVPCQSPPSPKAKLQKTKRQTP